jgi:hypothetical protein
MTDSPSDDSRLRATETQMRHALGLHGDTPRRSTSSGSQPQRRRFVRDGEVPVTVIRRDHQPDGEPGTNQLDAARQAIRSEAAARERAERSLNEAQMTIRDLQTKLAHERLAKDEALETIRRLETGTQAAAYAQETAEVELAAERLARRNAEDALAEALDGHHAGDGRLRKRDAPMAWHAPPHRLVDGTGTEQTAPARLDPKAEPDVIGTSRTTVRPIARKRRIGAGARGTSTAETDSDRGRASGDGNGNSDIVEWWEPGWREKFR